MQTHPINTDSFLLVFLYGAFMNLLADLDGLSLTEYAIKAVIGGACWLVFKLLADYLSLRLGEETKDKGGRIDE